jgi:hypothetical protein
MRCSALGNFSENLPTTTPVTGLGACATTLNAADKANTNYGGKFFVCDPVTHQPIAGNRADLDPNFTAEVDPVAAAVLKKRCTAAIAEPAYDGQPLCRQRRPAELNQRVS